MVFLIRGQLLYGQKSILAVVQSVKATFASQNYFYSKWVEEFQAGGP